MKKKIRFCAIPIALFIGILIVNPINAQRATRGAHIGGFGSSGSNVHFNNSFTSKSYRSPSYRSMSYRGNVYRTSPDYYSRSGNYVNNNAKPIHYKSVFRLPANHLRLSYGGNPYYYANGLFYNNYGAYYNLIRPPFGIRLGYLPSGYWSLNYGGYPYYYYSGVFYQNTQDNQYQVVQSPVGATVPAIPKDAKKIVVNGETLYDYLGTYYKETIDENGKVSYIVQGKDGVLNTDQQPEVTITNYASNIGDVVLQLPSQYKVVVINDKKMYVTPEHIYYEEFIDNGVLKYKVVGK